MHVVVYGAGGIGGFLMGKIGPLFSEPGSGVNNVSVVARGDHLQAIQSRGLTYRDPEQNERTVFPSMATDTPARLSRADIIFLCVKGYDLEKAVESVSRIVGTNTIVLPLLNGADIYDRVREILPKGIVLPGAIYISSSITAPGIVSHTGGKGLIITGSEPGSAMEQPAVLKELFEEAGILYEWHPDPLPAIWGKFVFIAPFCLVTAVAAKTIGEVCADPQLNSDVREMIAESARVAGAAGVNLPEDIVEQTMKKAESFPPDTKTSFQRDIEKHKARDERDLFGATLMRLGKKLGVETPVTESYHTALP